MGPERGGACVRARGRVRTHQNTRPRAFPVSRLARIPAHEGVLDSSPTPRNDQVGSGEDAARSGLEWDLADLMDGDSLLDGLTPPRTPEVRARGATPPPARASVPPHTPNPFSSLCPCVPCLPAQTQGGGLYVTAECRAHGNIAHSGRPVDAPQCNLAARRADGGRRGRSN